MLLQDFRPIIFPVYLAAALPQLSSTAQHCQCDAHAAG
jgi:hypothetical protein